MTTSTTIKSTSIKSTTIASTTNLTNREQNIISLLVCGKTNNEISKELSISIETVKKYITSILKKMNVRNRIQIAVKAIKEGMVKYEEVGVEDEDGMEAETEVKTEMETDELKAGEGIKE